MKCDKCEFDISSQKGQGATYYFCRCGYRYCSNCGRGRSQCDGCHQWNQIEPKFLG